MIEISTILNKIDTNDKTFYQSINDEDKKDLKQKLAWIIPQLMTGANNEADHEYLILAFDEFCNDKWYSLSDNDELQIKLLSSLSMGKSIYHKLFKPNIKSDPDSALLNFLRREFIDIKEEEVEVFCNSIGVEEMKEMLYELGVPIEEQEEIMKQYYEKKRDE